MDNEISKQPQTTSNAPIVRHASFHTLWFGLLVGAVIWLVAIIPVSLSFYDNGPDEFLFVRLGFVGLAGFWFAAGRLRWWMRLVAVGLVATLLGLTANQDSLQLAGLVGVTIFVTAAIAYGIRGLLSYILREENQSRSFSLAAMMQITAVAALTMLAIRFGVEYTTEGSLLEVARVLFYLCTLSFALAAQCMPLCGRRWRTILLLHAWALVCVVLTVVITSVGSYLFDDYVEFHEIVRIYLTANLALWSVVVPLQFVLSTIPWNLIRDDWMEQTTEGPAISSLRERHPWQDIVPSFFYECFSQQSTSEESRVRNPNWGMISAILVAFAITDLVAVKVMSSPGMDYSILIRLGQTGVLGFWLACGRARWWLRCFITVLLIPLLGWLDESDPVRTTLLLALSALLFAGITFLLRSLISLITRSSNKHHTISIKGIMFAMIGAAVLFVVLRAMHTLEFQGAQIYRLVLLVFHVSLLGIAFVMQCAVLWARQERVVRWWLFAGACAVCTMFASYGIQYLLIGMTDLEEWLEVYGFGVATIWLTVYPLDWSLRKQNWSLVQPGWSMEECPVDVSPKTSSPIKPPSAELLKSNSETVDFDDIY